MKWRIYYIDGTTFSNDDGAPQEAPGARVAAVVQEDGTVGVQIHRGCSFYVCDEQYGGWYGLDHFGFAQYLERPGYKVIKLGEAMTTDGYRALLKQLQDDPDLPAKSARYEWEEPL